MRMYCPLNGTGNNGVRIVHTIYSPENEGDWQKIAEMEATLPVVSCTEINSMPLNVERRLPRGRDDYMNVHTYKRVSA